MVASPKPVESADAQVAFREMYYSRFPRVAYPTRAYHHRRPLMAEATGVAGSDDTHVAGEAIGRQAFLLGEVLRHAEDGRVLRQAVDCHDRQEVMTPPTSDEELALWQFADDESLAEGGCTSEGLKKSQKKWMPQRHGDRLELRGSMESVDWPVVVEEVIEGLVADEMYRRYIDDGQC